MNLKPFQKEGVKALNSILHTNNSVCLAWYTGAGKTNVLCEWIKDYIDKNPIHKVGISAYLTTEIRKQIFERLAEFNLQYLATEITCGEDRKKSSVITVFNPQGIHNKKFKIKFDVLAIDEAHAAIHDECKMMKKIMKKNCKKTTKYILLTATPWDTLAQKRWKKTPVLKRPLDKGLEDGLITDFKFITEEALISFDPDDFSKEGDIRNTVLSNRVGVIKSACMGKMEYILSKYDKDLGDKVIVICPPGNNSEIASEMAEKFGGLSFVYDNNLSMNSRTRNLFSNLEKFKQDPSVRFLFVVYKCTVGFDMPKLSSVVDLTMTRNIRTLAQRIGRVARKDENNNKNYFYIYDTSLMKDQIQWLLMTMVDFSLGNYDGWTTEKSKWRIIHARNRYQRESIMFSEIVKDLRDPHSYGDPIELKFLSHEKPTRRSLDEAISEALKFSSRTDMWKRKPALYKWFRLNNKKEMDKIFPLKYKLSGWTKRKVISAMKKCTSRKQFQRQFSGAYSWLEDKGMMHLKDQYLPPPNRGTLWSHEKVVDIFKNINSWTEFRVYHGARQWIINNGGTEKYKQIFHKMKTDEKSKT